MSTMLLGVVTTVYLRGTQNGRVHLSLDAHRPLCGQGALSPYAECRGAKANCKLCRDLVHALNRRLEEDSRVEKHAERSREITRRRRVGRS
jgi:hypothetical protein